MPTQAQVIVVGAGLSGLAAAYQLQRRGYQVRVLEAMARVGGVIASPYRNGMLFETGANSALDSTPLFDTLLKDLGIDEERRDVNPAATTRYIVRRGRLVALPSSPGGLLGTRALSLAAKLRLLAEPFIPPLRDGREESVAAFARRRLGPEIADYAIDPMIAGIYAGDPEQLSLPAAFPRLFALEQTYGSLLKGALRERRANQKNAGSGNAGRRTSFSFVHGMQTLTDALARQLARIETDTTVERLERANDGGFVLSVRRTRVIQTYSAQAVVLTVPAREAGNIIAASLPLAARALRGIDYAPIAIAANLYRRTDIAHPLSGFGFLVPRKEGRSILGTLFSSTLFEGRAPSGTVLLTSFVGGQRQPELVGIADDALGSLVNRDLAALISAPALPLRQELLRWPHAIPQYVLGHRERLQVLAEAEAAWPGLRFCANYRGGVAIGDRIRSAQDNADAIDHTLRED